MRAGVVLLMLAVVSTAGADGATVPFDGGSEGCATSVTGPNLRALAEGAGLAPCFAMHEGEMSALCAGNVCTVSALGTASGSGGALLGVNEIELSVRTPSASPGLVCAAGSLGDLVECAGAASVAVPLALGACAPVHVTTWFVQDQPLPEGDWRTSVASATVTSSAMLCHTSEGASLDTP